MQIPVVINPLANQRFQARGGSPFPLVAEGETPAEAVQNLRQMIQDQLAAGATVCRLDIPDQDNPWLKMAGMWDRDDPLVQEWKEIMRENRLTDEEAPNNP